jgi:ATP-dependent RNA helicase RhlE
VEILVLDEADRMLDMGFIRDIRRILIALPSKRQNLFFSATFTKEIRALADSFLQSPVEVAVAQSTVTADLISQVVHPVDKDRKRAALEHLINAGDWRQVLVFARTKHGANRLAEQLDKGGISADAIHGNKSQSQRTRALAQFKDGKVRVLVATDIAARGLDIEQLPHVVNYELPNVPEDYIHRIGRTGRAGSSGQAVSLVCSEEGEFLRDIERLLNRGIERVVIEGFQPTGAPLRTDRASATARQGRPQQRQQQGRTRSQGQGVRGEARRGQGSGSKGLHNSERQRSGNGDARRGDAQPHQNSNRSVSSLLGGNR